MFVDEYKHLEYLFVWNTCAACPVGNPIRDKCSPKPLDECNFLGGRSMGTGTVLILAFVIIFTFYIVVGVLYKRFVLGASGVEQIPNVDMWCGCLESISLGCSSIIGKCSGGGSKPISTYAVRPALLRDPAAAIRCPAALVVAASCVALRQHMPPIPFLTPRQRTGGEPGSLRERVGDRVRRCTRLSGGEAKLAFACRAVATSTLFRFDLHSPLF